ncbi:MAG: hypothetical protein KA965_05185 [Butyrivibrio sp.]|nr:hypothetical protein [Butyrivibrio sp.]
MQDRMPDLSYQLDDTGEMKSRKACSILTEHQGKEWDPYDRPEPVDRAGTRGKKGSRNGDR